MIHEYQLPSSVASFYTENANAYAIWSELVEELAEPSEVQKQQLVSAATVYANIDVARQLLVPQLVELGGLVVTGTISKSQVREVIEASLSKGLEPTEVVTQLGLGQVSDEGELGAIVAQVLAANPDAVAKYRSGKVEILGFLVGQIMREAKGKANPSVVNQLLEQQLKG